MWLKLVIRHIFAPKIHSCDYLHALREVFAISSTRSVEQEKMTVTFWTV